MHAFCIVQNVVIPESQDAVALSLDQPCPLRINFLIVLTAVAFDHQLGAVACKSTMCGGAALGAGIELQETPHARCATSPVRPSWRSSGENGRALSNRWLDGISSEQLYDRRHPSPTLPIKGRERFCCPTTVFM